MKPISYLKSAALVAILPFMVGAASAENVLRWSSQGDALTLDPMSQNEGPTITMNQQIYEPLVRRNSKLELEPALATEWRPIDSNAWEFKLRRGVKFHDGADFTAEDVAFSIMRAQAESSDFKEQVRSIVDVKVVDDFTVHLVTDGPNPILPNQLTNLFIMDKGWAETHNVMEPQDYAAGQENYAVRNANGTGAFILDQRLPDELTVLRKNPDWWGLQNYPHNVDKVEYRPIRSAATRVAALLSGELDFVLDPPLQDLQRIESRDGLKVVTVPQIRTIFFGMDQGVDELRTSNVKGKNPFKDVRVRRAMNMALDVDAIRRVVMEGLSYPAGIITSPGVHGFTEALDQRPPFDVDGAKALLADAGYPNGFSVQLDCPNDRYNNDEQICQAAVSMLARIGVNARLEAITKAQHFPKLSNRESDFYMLGWGVPTLDSHYVFSYLFASDGSWNATGYANAKVDELTAAMAVETDLAKRDRIIADAWKTVKDDAVYIPVHHQVIAWAMSEKLDLPIVANDSPQFFWAAMN